jgi:putative toxin-antitoxin system antitoxin component (TIGR02293 family)
LKSGQCRPNVIQDATVGGTAVSEAKSAEILAKATDVLGSPANAQAWLESPAIALDQAKPLQLMDTSTGKEMVRTLLTRIEYGVYT